ncbi:MAG: DNA-processing protein DprA [Desulfuromonas sp.]|nr:DNA-processing protein DprA [Desulfuromonas sp.]
MHQDSQQNWLRLHLTAGLGRIGINKLIATFGSATEALKQSRHEWTRQANLTSKRIGTPPALNEPIFVKAWDNMLRCHARIISLWDKDYPSQLRTIHDPPALLYIRGELPQARYFAIVGSRHATPDGARFAREIAGQLSEYNICIVSGLARGIDAAAHIGAMQGQGSTVAVLGCGIDRVYPAKNRDLFKQIEQQGAIISEYPPGTEPHAGHFPARNRIISGLSEGALIVEAADNSGSLLTADFALDQGRDVYAAPGSVYNANCQGNFQLLKQGAILVTATKDILQNLNIAEQVVARQSPLNYSAAQLNEKQKIVLNILQPTPLHLDQLAQQSGLTPMDVSAIVLHLELEGLASALPGGRYIRGFAG